MIIRKIQIDNYLCYYDTNIFELTEGLNIILGENGEGKTKFFEAVEWLFDGEDTDLDTLISAKKLKEVEIGDSFRVRVSVTVEQYGERSIITKSFLAKKEGENECSTSNLMIEGIEENNSGERNQIDGSLLLDRVFPFQIRKYSMFKGEAELNIFESDSALVNLINLFSEAKHYDKYSDKGAFLREKAEKAVEDSSKLDKKNEALYKRLESEISKLENDKAKYFVHLNSTEDEIRKIEVNLQSAESHVSNADALDTLNKRIKEFEDKISVVNKRIDENYTTSLFDENWILVNFEPFHKEFAEKVFAHSKKHRELQSEFDREMGRKEGEKKAKADLLNNSVPLPIGVPSKSHMEEMLADKICKVCNRPAKPAGTPEEIKAYNFMMERLKTYLESQIVNESDLEDEDFLFKFDYTNRLENLSTSHEDNLKNLRQIRTKIKEVFEFNDKQKVEIEDLNELLEKEKNERERILGNSNIAEEKLIDVLKNYNAWQRDLKLRNQEHIDYETKLKNIKIDLDAKREEKDKIDTNSANSFLIKTRNILRDIEIIFKDTKGKKFDEFIEKLETKSNKFLDVINVDSFTGEISIYKKIRLGKTTVEVQLMQNGRPFYKPNESLETSMYIAVLFAISELAYETNNEYYPLIFDAPTSSFGDYKTAQFLNLIYETNNQKILLTKNFLDRDKASRKLYIKNDLESVKRHKAFWVKLEEPFDKNDLSTINSQVITL